MTPIVRLRVVIYEDNEPVNDFDIGYYSGQEYVVKLETPDGVDVMTETREAGGDK